MGGAALVLELELAVIPPRELVHGMDRDGAELLARSNGRCARAPILRTAALNWSIPPASSMVRMRSRSVALTAKGRPRDEQATAPPVILRVLQQIKGRRRLPQTRDRPARLLLDGCNFRHLGQ